MHWHFVLNPLRGTKQTMTSLGNSGLSRKPEVPAREKSPGTVPYGELSPAPVAGGLNEGEIMNRAYALSITACFAILCLLSNMSSQAKGQAPAAATKADPSPSGPSRWIVTDEGPVELVPIDRIAIRFAPQISAAERDQFIRDQPLLASAEPVESFPAPEFEIWSIRPSHRTPDLARACRDLARDPRVEEVSPVYRSFQIDLIPTGEVFLQLREGEGREVLATILPEFGLEIAAETPWRRGNYLLRVLPASARDALEIAAELAARPEIEFCVPNFVRRLPRLSAPDDPLYPGQWNLQNTGQAMGAVVDADADAPEAWEISEGCASVTIAILDEGCDMTHPDYASKLVGGWDFPGNDSIPEPNSWDGHGTACAGVAAAHTHNARGIAGVDGRARILPIRIAYSPQPGANWVTTDQWLSDAIAWAALQGADVLSNSWGGGPPSDQIHAAIREAVQNGRGGLGSVVVFASGNDNLASPSYPALYEETIAVGATSPCDERKNPGSCDRENWGANFGPGLDVSAPGVFISCTDIQGSGGYNTQPGVAGDYYTRFNGTSSATPQVAGLAGLLVCKYPHYEGAEIRARIEQTCDKVGGYAYDAVTGMSQELGHGRINLYRALSGKPQVIGGPLPQNPSVYREAGDAAAPYPTTRHETAAYEWLGEEYSPETGADDNLDPDGPSNRPGRDAFEDGVLFSPPYLPGRIGSVRVRVSVEDSRSRRYAAGQRLYLNLWFDWTADGNWNNSEDWVVRQYIVEPSTWGGAMSRDIPLTFPVPDQAIGWHIQNRPDGLFLNVRARLTYEQQPADAAQAADAGEVEDYRFVNFVEMFDSGPGYMNTVPIPCDPWEWVNTPPPWMPNCLPHFRPDGGNNGFMTAAVYNLGYAGDESDGLRTPSFDLSEMTQARLLFEHSAVEMIFGRVRLYVGGLPYATLRVYNGIPTTPPVCGLVLTETIDLTPYCGDGFGDVVIAFEVDHDEACGTAFPAYQDWLIDNVTVVAQDVVSPAGTTVAATPLGPNTARVDWIAPGDDGPIRRAELYNIRYGPEVIDASNWRHALWVRRDMSGGILVPQPPGALESIQVAGLSGGLHHFALRTLDEVNNISGINDGGVNHPPDQTAPDSVTVVEGTDLTFTVAATDPDFDPLLLSAWQKPPAASYIDAGNNTATLSWTPGSGDLGTHSAVFLARDPNGATDRDTTVILVLAAGGTGACCLPAGCCILTTASSCAGQGGAYQGSGTTCSPNPCAPLRPDWADHDVGACLMTVTDQGTVGFMDGSQAEGQGFVYPRAGGQNHLFIGGLWVGSSPSSVANRDFDADPAREWKVTACPDGRCRGTTGGSADQEILASFADSNTASPRGLFVEQESWAWASPSSDDDFVIVRYRISNRSAAPLTGLYAGVMQDLDLNGQSGDDVGNTDRARRLVFMNDPSGVHVGLRLLDLPASPLPLVNLTLISNATFVYPNQYILDADKDAFLRAADPQHILISATTPGDYCVLVSAGPFDLFPAEEREMAVAFIGGQSLAHLQANADRAQALYAGATSEAPDSASALTGSRLSLLCAPNPFGGRTQVRFELPRSGPVSLGIYDVSGRLVRSLHSGIRPAGLQNVIWDGRDEDAREVGAGVYFARMHAEGRELSRRLVRVR